MATPKRSNEPHSQHCLHRRRSPSVIQSSLSDLFALNPTRRVQNATQTRGYLTLCAARSMHTSSPLHCCSHSAALPELKRLRAYYCLSPRCLPLEGNACCRRCGPQCTRKCLTQLPSAGDKVHAGDSPASLHLSPPRPHLPP